VPDPRELRDLAESVARQAGALLHGALGLARSEVGTKSSATDMVTEMDRASESLIVEGLLGARPDDGLLGEEGTSVDGRSGVRWIVDPLDGTTNYLYGLPGFNVSLAAEVDGAVVAGVVLDVVRGELFSAVRGQGATLDGQPISASDATSLATALVGTGFSYDADRRRRQAQVLVEVLPEVRDIRRFGAAALDLCWVGAGRLDAYYERGLAPWDLAAGGLVAAEAGAVVTDLPASAPGTGSVMAAATGIAEDLLTLLERAGAGSA